MSDKVSKYTLWTNPMEDWTRIFKDTTVTQEDIEEMSKAASAIDESKLDERLRPFQTPVSSETMSRFVK